MFMKKNKIRNFKVAYLINHVAFFDSHISPIALKAKNSFSIKLFCGNSASKEMESYAIKNLKKKKIKFIRSNFSASGLNILNEFRGFISLYNSIKKFSPDLMHCATPKGIFFGTMVSFFLGIKSLVIFNTGMGYLFTSKLSFYQRFIRFLYIQILKFFIKKNINKKIIIENNHDLRFLKRIYNLKKNDFILIKGSGVNLNKFSKINITKNKLVVLPSRVIKEKGIKEFIIAAEKLKKKFPNWKFVVAGTLSYKKQSNFSIGEINFLNRSRSVKFLGYVKDMKKIYNKSSIVCLPSYREGFSKTLQEAAAMGIPTVTTNAIGCKDAIIQGITGEICLVRDSKSLEKKLEYLMKNPKKRILYGINGRRLAEKEFDLEEVVNKNINIYKKLLKNEKKSNLY